MEAFLLARHADPLWERIRWGTMDGWIGGALTVGALYLTYRLLRQQATALNEQRAALADERAERRRDFYRSYALLLRPVLKQARTAFGDITSSAVVTRSFKDPRVGPVFTDLGDIRPAAAADAELDRQVGIVLDEGSTNTATRNTMPPLSR